MERHEKIRNKTIDPKNPGKGKPAVIKIVLKMG
jgi:hypothetical protein